MNKISSMLCGVVALGAVSLSAQSRAPGFTDLVHMQGAWVMVSGAADGMPMPPSSARAMKRQLVGSELTVTMSGQLYFKATIALDSTHTPRTIDYHMTGGPTSGAVQRGLYEFHGPDTLRFIFGAPGADRPMDWTSKAGDGRTLSIWARVKP